MERELIKFDAFVMPIDCDYGAGGAEEDNKPYACNRFSHESVLIVIIEKQLLLIHCKLIYSGIVCICRFRHPLPACLSEENFVNETNIFEAQSSTISC